MNDLHLQIQKILELLRTDLGTIRAGRATPALVENVMITAYGGSAKLKVMELATIGALDTHTLQITPFDPSTIHDIEKGIQEANIGLSPVVDGQLLRIKIPSLTQERREELIKAMKQKLENGKIMVRQARHEAMEQVKKEYEGNKDEIQRQEKEIQRVVDQTIEGIEEMGRAKEAELLQI
ncbi:MAG TPA: ribosome recycling factor [Patescibacteria group bacterium]|nr:ribosome recycling factor [Patescibacteria group bacterium]